MTFVVNANVLSICSGAFSGLEHIVNRRVARSSIGFEANMKVDVGDAEVQGSYFDMVEPNDLVAYGLIPEFIGRFPVITLCGTTEWSTPSALSSSACLPHASASGCAK